MFVTKDGTVTGSIDVSKLDEIEPKTDEARAQLDAMKAELKFGQEQSARDAERVAEVAEAQREQLRGADVRDMSQDGSFADDDEKDAERKQAKAEQGDEAKQAEETQKLQAEAEQAGVTVDKRWGPDRLRQEIDSANAAKAASRKQR
jgi:hypothetical protein